MLECYLHCVNIFPQFGRIMIFFHKLKFFKCWWNKHETLSNSCGDVIGNKIFFCFLLITSFVVANVITQLHLLLHIWLHHVWLLIWLHHLWLHIWLHNLWLLLDYIICDCISIYIICDCIFDYIIFDHLIHCIIYDCIIVYDDRTYL